ncbi:MAG: hypothetical protein PGN13_14725 [Patulibacter minatonensis]
MSAFDHLERQLTRSVDDGMASTAARAARTVQGRRTRRRAWLHGPRLFLLALVVAGGGTGALAATGVLRIAPADPMALTVFGPHEGIGVRTGPVDLLPLRVDDPNGGPPWVLRTFRTTRGVACLQGGQLYRGRFGLVERDEQDRRVFRLSEVGVGGSNVRCTTRIVDGRPVISGGLRTVAMDGGAQSRSRCGRGAGEGSGGCPIRTVAVIRFGTLGPQARAARWLDGGGRQHGRTLRLDAGTGGAYLFAERADPAPWRAMQRLDMEVRDEAKRRFPMAAPGVSLSAPARRAAQRRDRRRITFLMQQLRAQRPERRRLYAETTGDERIEASFAGGRRLLVAGRGAWRGALPGVVVARPDVPADVREPVGLRYRSTGRPVIVAFRSPTTIDRPGEALRITIRGPKAPGCTRHEVSSERWLDHDRAEGGAVRVQVGQGIVDAPFLTAAPPPPKGGRYWCAGARYVLRVRYSASRDGHRVERLIGQRAFVAH